jgi:hypothetical protein
MFKFQAVLARIQPFLSRSVENRGDQSRFKSLGLYTNGARSTCRYQSVVADAPIVRSAAWTWRRGALIDSLMLERGETYLVVPVGAEDQEPGVFLLHSIRFLLI